VTEPQKKKAKNALVDKIGDFYIDNSCAVTQAELLRYKSEPAITVDEDPLHWWTIQQNEFPNLAKASRKCLGIVSTSVPSESLISSAGKIISVEQAPLLPENVEKLVFLH
jgi:hypothetical protein